MMPASRMPQLDGAVSERAALPSGATLHCEGSLGVTARSHPLEAIPTARTARSLRIGHAIHRRQTNTQAVWPTCAACLNLQSAGWPVVACRALLWKAFLSAVLVRRGGRGGSCAAPHRGIACVCSQQMHYAAACGGYLAVPLTVPLPGYTYVCVCDCAETPATMEIVHVYQKKRADFGRQCNFTDRPATVLAEVIPDETLMKDYMRLDPCEATIQNAFEFSEHEVRSTLCPRLLVQRSGGGPHSFLLRPAICRLCNHVRDARCAIASVSITGGTCCC